MNVAEFGKNLLISGLWFYVGENVFFGWNATPQSMNEKICDVYSFVVITFGIMFLFWTTIDLIVWFYNAKHGETGK